MSRAAEMLLAVGCLSLACGGSQGVPGKTCAPGQHDGGGGVCVALGTCSVGFHDGGDGQCTPVDACGVGYRLGSDGTCLKASNCSAGTHDNGAGVCVATITCPAGYHDGGSGTCVPTGSCSGGYHDGGNGECWILAACASGYHDGGTGTCVPLVACSAGFHDGGDGRCVRDGGCSGGFHDGGDGRCVAPDRCSAGYHDGGGGVCIASAGCATGYRDDGTGVCACRPSAGMPEGICVCANGFHDDGKGTCTASGCATGYHDGGDGRCVAATTCTAGFYDDGSGVCRPRADAGPIGVGGAGGAGGMRDAAPGATGGAGGAGGAGGTTIPRDGNLPDIPSDGVYRTGGAGAGGTQSSGGATGTGGSTTTCGDGKVDRNELCDCGTDPQKLPTGCAAVNGLFYGDGKGCSRTCTKEPSCRDSSGKTQACTTACGDGNLDANERCDDGNLQDGDGCSSTCVIEDGFTCTTTILQDTQPCQSGSGQCIRLPIIYRDFQPENVPSGGHPDFSFFGTRYDASSSSTTVCVPNAGGPAKGNDSTPRCWGILADSLKDGKPQAGATRTCDCQYSDWNIGNSTRIQGGYTMAQNDSPLSDGKGGYLGPTAGTKVNTVSAAGTYTGTLTGYTSSTPGGPIWKGTVPAYKDAASLQQWFSDDNTVNKTFSGVLELTSIGTNLYQYASKVHLGTGGFFPLDTLNPSQKTLCNLWPYWNHGNGSPIWSTCRGDQYLFSPHAVPSDCPSGDLLDDGCWVTSVAGETHDYYFTSEARHHFVYDGDDGLTFMFYGDDDLFVFINGVLVLDLGGVHQPLPGKVTVFGNPGDARVVEGGCLDAAGNVVGVTAGAKDCSPTSGYAIPAASPDDFRNRTVKLGLETGKTYELALFHADRHPPESNFQLTMAGFTTRRSVCQPH